MAAPSRPGSSDFHVARPRGVCAASNESIEPGEAFMAALRETPQGFERLDVRLPHWETLDRSEVVAFWRAKMPHRDQPKKRLFVDDAVLLELLERLADVAEPAKLSFRFVLMLILMRKRLVTYEGQRVADDGREVWRVRPRGREASIEIVDPKPTEEQIGQVQEQLGQILSEDA